MSTSALSLLFPFSMARRAVVKSPLVSSTITSSRSLSYSGGGSKQEEGVYVVFKASQRQKQPASVSPLQLFTSPALLSQRVFMFHIKMQMFESSSSSQTLFEDTLEFFQFLVGSCCQNLHQDVFICAQSLPVSQERSKLQTLLRNPPEIENTFLQRLVTWIL